MPSSPSRAKFRDETRGWDQPTSRDPDGNRHRPRSQSPRSDRGSRDARAVSDADRRRNRDADERDVGQHQPLKRRRRESEYGRERDATRSHSPGEDEDSGRASRRHHHRHRHRHNRHVNQQSTGQPARTKEFPFGARELSRSDLTAFRPLFAHYLDLQKQLDITSLDENEVRGRWKSFMGKWNRGELAEGWYDPEVFERALNDYGDVMYAGPAVPPSAPLELAPAEGSTNPHPSGTQDRGNKDDEDDDYGPPPPPPAGHHNLAHLATSSIPSSALRAPGPAIPSQTDLSLRDEALAAARHEELSDLRHARRAHRREAQALLDEAAPRADAGTRERRLEKRKELNEKLRGFRERSPTGGGGEADEGELMGGGDGVAEYKAIVHAQETKKQERVSRREEMERARRAEREERLRGYREREERVVEGLRELARRRFGVP